MPQPGSPELDYKRLDVYAEIRISLVQEVLDRFGDIRQLEQVIIDRGSQFYANKKDKNGRGESSFESFLKSSEIKHIKADLSTPTNGTVEKWNDLYKKHRLKFNNFDSFVWYNTVRYHERLNTKHCLQTPDDAFWIRLPQACMVKMFLNLAEEEFNVKERIQKRLAIYKLNHFGTLHGFPSFRIERTQVVKESMIVKIDNSI